MKISRVIGLLAVVAFVVPMVSAASIGNENDEAAGLLSQADGYGTRECYTITQGELDSCLQGIPAGVSLLKVDLYWFTPVHSLRLDIYRPDGIWYGTYYDNYGGGRPDGWIHVEINNPASGDWRFEVYGESVTGTIPYALTFDAYA